MKETQLDFFLTTEESRVNHEIQEYKKITHRSIRGLYARNSEMKKDLDAMQSLMKEVFNLKVDSKIVIFESDNDDVVNSLVVSDQAFFDSELLEYKKITDKSINSLKFKYNENERILLNLEQILMKAVFKEMENRAQA